MRLHRLVLLAGAPLALAALLGSAAPAHAGWNNTIMTNGLSNKAFTGNGLQPDAPSTTGAALDDLDGVQVEVVVPPAASP
jgi:hypothetical protein